MTKMNDETYKLIEELTLNDYEWSNEALLP